jgi:hypothetical protein
MQLSAARFPQAVATQPRGTFDLLKGTIGRKVQRSIAIDDARELCRRGFVRRALNGGQDRRE